MEYSGNGRPTTPRGTICRYFPSRSIDRLTMVGIMGMVIILSHLWKCITEGTDEP